MLWCSQVLMCTCDKERVKVSNRNNELAKNESDILNEIINNKEWKE